MASGTGEAVNPGVQIMDEGGRAGSISSMMWPEWLSTLCEMIKEEGERGSGDSPASQELNQLHETMLAKPFGGEMVAAGCRFQQRSWATFCAACSRGWQPQGLGRVALELAWLTWISCCTEVREEQSCRTLGQLLTLCNSSRTAHTQGVIKLSFVLQYTFTLPAHGKLHREM